MEVIAALAIVAIAGFWVVNYRPLYRIVYGGPPPVRCGKLPNVDVVQAALQEHQDVIAAIEAVSPQHTDVDMDTRRCPGKADIEITYATRDDRAAIQAIIGDDTFFGVPYWMRNI